MLSSILNDNLTDPSAICQLFFLPAYAPDLNAIEHLGAAFKTRRCEDLSTAANSSRFIANM